MATLKFIDNQIKDFNLVKYFQMTSIYLIHQSFSPPEFYTMLNHFICILSGNVLIHKIRPSFFSKDKVSQIFTEDLYPLCNSESFCSSLLLFWGLQNVRNSRRRCQ